MGEKEKGERVAPGERNKASATAMAITMEIGGMATATTATTTTSTTTETTADTTGEAVDCETGQEEEAEEILTTGTETEEDTETTTATAEGNTCPPQGTTDLTGNQGTMRGPGRKRGPGEKKEITIRKTSRTGQQPGTRDQTWRKWNGRLATCQRQLATTKEETTARGCGAGRRRRKTRTPGDRDYKNSVHKCPKYPGKAK